MTIKEVSEKFDLSQDTLRFYEKKGLIGPVKKTSGGIRDYDEDDLNRIEFVKCMRSAFVPIAVLKKYIDLFEAGDFTKDERVKLLEKQREILKEKLEDMQKAYDRLDKKINLYYDGKLDQYMSVTKKKESD